MLKQRIITAACILAFLLPAIFARNPWPFTLLTLALIGAAGWEWGRLNGSASFLAASVGAWVVCLCVTAIALGWWITAPALLWWLAVLVWVGGGAWAIRYGAKGWGRCPRAVRQLSGVLLLTLAWLALANSKMRGVNFLLSVFSLVWTADIAAYFGGRAFGRRKLAPAISPGKSWEGVWSGMVGVLLVGWLWYMVVDQRIVVDSQSLYSELVQRLGAACAALALVFLSAMSVVGDLVESLVKRSAGAKDSSSLLPGHGGLLDRVDALLPVLPLAVALTTVQSIVD